MKDESEAFQRSLLKLFQELLPETFDQYAIHGVDQGANQTAEHHRPEPFTGEVLSDASSTTSDYRDLEAISPEWETLVELGEIPAVQDRFHTLLKHRLQAEIERHPPLFPWESEIQDYESENSTYAPSIPVVSQSNQAGLWLGQLAHLNLPVAVPEAVLTQLLKRCQEIAQSSLREGAKLVRAVEDLFPGQDPALHYLAGLVMTSPARSGGTVTEKSTDATYPSSYETAEPAQQMVLSLLAAQQILTALTLTVSSGIPMQRQWLTEVGPLTLQVDYGTEKGQNLRVKGTLPQAGSLTLRGNDLIAIAQRGDAGSLRVELLDLGRTEVCQLEVRLCGYEQEPLVLVVKLTHPAG